MEQESVIENAIDLMARRYAEHWVDVLDEVIEKEGYEVLDNSDYGGDTDEELVVVVMVEGSTFGIWCEEDGSCRVEKIVARTNE